MTIINSDAMIFSNRVPLGDVGYVDFIELVVEKNVRPGRLDDEDAPNLSDLVFGFLID